MFSLIPDEYLETQIDRVPILKEKVEKIIDNEIKLKRRILELEKKIELLLKEQKKTNERVKALELTSSSSE
jgi:hypothetical protein